MDIVFLRWRSDGIPFNTPTRNPRYRPARVVPIAFSRFSDAAWAGQR
jgi:hypothetical protein